LPRITDGDKQEVLMSGLKKALLTFAVVASGVLAIELAGPTELIAQIRAALVRDADHPGRNGFTFRHNTSTSTFVPIMTVPAGKILVLEHLNCSALDPDLYVGVFQGSLSHANIVMSAPVISTAATVTIADTDAKAVVQAGAALNLRIFDPGNAQVTCSLTGYTIDATP
jgi:hypothetical protein